MKEKKTDYCMLSSVFFFLLYRSARESQTILYLLIKFQPQDRSAICSRVMLGVTGVHWKDDPGMAQVLFFVSAFWEIRGVIFAFVASIFMSSSKELMNYLLPALIYGNL